MISFSFIAPSCTEFAPIRVLNPVHENPSIRPILNIHKNHDISAGAPLPAGPGPPVAAAPVGHIAGGLQSTETERLGPEPLLGRCGRELDAGIIMPVKMARRQIRVH